MRDDEPPAGYVQFTTGNARVVCAEHLTDALKTALARGTLYDYASRHPQARALAGRGTAYAIPFPDDADRVVVRHNRHGGALASLTGDLFRSPTRAPVELQISERLRAVDVPTPRVVAYARYAALPGFERADLATREVPDSHDLSVAICAADAPTRVRALRAASALVAALARAGARHHDLNVKNILLHAPDGGELSGLVLDVDRVELSVAEREALEGNLTRLLRSARKWQSLHGARVTETELLEFASLARTGAAVHSATRS